MSASKVSTIQCFHHIEFLVSNAQQASFWHCFHFGFRRFAQCQTKHSSEIAIKKGTIVFVFKCSTSPDDPEGIGAEVGKRGDFVKDVSYEVDNLDAVLETLRGNGLELLAPKREISDQNGSVAIAKIAGSAGSIVHTLVQNIDYRGLFLPDFKPVKDFCFSSSAILPSIPLICLDHVVEAHPEQTVDNAVDWYQRTFQMRRFWSIDDKTVHTEFSALRALLVGNDGSNGSVKMVMVEPVNVNGVRRNGQIEEFLHFHGSSGIQHIAFLTENIVQSVRLLRERGVEFLDIPNSYYDMLEQRLAGSKFSEEIGKDLGEIREMNILMDFDEHGYLLQIFTKPIQDRMTFFLEVIQRNNFSGFGAGNFRALFEAVEMEQKRRESEQKQPPEAAAAAREEHEQPTNRAI
uniref:4-hydroxyphenylpyruvate dioxygenase n=1 Tax=Globodera pallida TaxID=36090 RepID=A0A183C0Y0_GLOPA